MNIPDRQISDADYRHLLTLGIIARFGDIRAASIVEKLNSAGVKAAVNVIREYCESIIAMQLEIERITPNPKEPLCR
jgi:hypothetical protein